MARRSSSKGDNESRRPTLQMSRAEAENRLKARVEKGKELLALPIRSEDQLSDLRAEIRKWSDYNFDLLKTIVDTNDLADGYYSGAGWIMRGPVSLSEEINEEHSDLKRYIRHLESVLGRLELIPEAPNTLEAPGRVVQVENNQDTVIVNKMRRLRVLREKQALQGFNTPAETLLEIEDLENELRQFGVL